MEKYECIACGYIYDPAIGDPTAGIEPAHLLKTCPKIGSAPIAALARINSRKSANINQSSK
jgi:rubredoxin